MHFPFRITTLILATAIALVGCSDPSWKPSAPGSVMAEGSSPDNKLLAQVVATETKGTYIFKVHNIRKGNVLAQRTITAPIGYHAHIVSLKWSEDGLSVTATIDHDFADDNRVFDIRIE